MINPYTNVYMYIHNSPFIPQTLLLIHSAGCTVGLPDECEFEAGMRAITPVYRVNYANKWVVLMVRLGIGPCTSCTESRSDTLKLLSQQKIICQNCYEIQEWKKDEISISVVQLLAPWTLNPTSFCLTIQSSMKQGWSLVKRLWHRYSCQCFTLASIWACAACTACSFL